MSATKSAAKDYLGAEGHAWFSSMIQGIKWDHLLMQEGIASEEKTRLYTDIITGNFDSLMSDSRKRSTMHFAMNLLNEYLDQMKGRQIRPNKIAFDLTDSSILVWAEISDDDYETERALILAEAFANAKFLETGFHLTSMIVEESDRLSIPTHYSSVQLPKA